MKAQAEKQVSPVRAQTSNGVSTPQVIYGNHQMVDRFGWSVINWGKVLSWLVVLTPLALWLPHYSFTQLWVVPGLYVTLAKIGSLVGTSMMAWSIILSARYRWLDKRFKGLDKMYKLHHTFGALAFCGILWHALWLTVKFQANTGNAWATLWLTESPAIRMGILAFVLLVFFLFFTAMVSMKYDTFVRVHRFLGIMFIIGATHAFWVHGQMDVNPNLYYYMLALCSLAIFSFVYHSIMVPTFKLRYRYKVHDVHHYGGDVVEVCLERRGRPMIFAPGQFAYVSFEASGLTESHPYSMSSGSREHLLRFTIKSLGDYTNRLTKLKKGTKAYIEGPFGGFSYLNGRRKQQVWVAGGIGITPFLAMARSFKRGYQADLYYCAKTKSEMVFLDELMELSDKHKGFNLMAICEDTDGFISAGTISKASGDLMARDFFFCGPPVMTDNLTKQLKELGVSDEQIHAEDFRY